MASFSLNIRIETFPPWVSISVGLPFGVPGFIRKTYEWFYPTFKSEEAWLIDFQKNGLPSLYRLEKWAEAGQQDDSQPAPRGHKIDDLAQLAERYSYFELLSEYPIFTSCATRTLSLVRAAQDLAEKSVFPWGTPEFRGKRAAARDMFCALESKVLVSVFTSYHRHT